MFCQQSKRKKCFETALNAIFGEKNKYNFNNNYANLRKKESMSRGEYSVLCLYVDP